MRSLRKSHAKIDRCPPLSSLVENDLRLTCPYLLVLSPTPSKTLQGKYEDFDYFVKKFSGFDQVRSPQYERVGS